MQWRLDLYAATDYDETEFNGTVMPLEIDRTASVAITLTEQQFWTRELSAFLGDAIGVHTTARLVATEPYRPGQIPVVFVHGTIQPLFAGRHSQRSRERSAWFALLSGSSATTAAIRSPIPPCCAALPKWPSFLDPPADACLQHMVVVDPPGRVADKMAANDSGAIFWDGITKMPFDEIRIADRVTRLAQGNALRHATVSSTASPSSPRPAHGSYLAGPQLIRRPQPS